VEGAAGKGNWDVLLGVAFLFLSIDEMIALHQRFARRLER
jgi:hypothetical protein